MRHHCMGHHRYGMACDRSLSDQRVEDLLKIQMSILHLKPMSGIHDGWEQEGPLSQFGEITEQGKSGYHLLDAESFPKGADFWLAAPYMQTDDADFGEEMFPDELTECAMCMGGEEDGSRIFF